jgi:hypothetical protein
LARRLGGDILTWVPAFTFVSVGVLNALVYDVVRRLQPHRWVAAVAAASVGLSGIAGVWSTSGLETGFYALGLFATYERLALREEGPDPVGGAIWAVLTAMSRFEGILWMGVIGGIALVTRTLRGEKPARPLAIWAVALGLVYGAYTLWRYSTFGLWLPSTAHAKIGFTLPVLMRGIDYVSVQVLTSLSLLWLLPGTWAALRPERRWTGLGVAAMAWGFPVYAALVGGDFMTFSRFMVPMLPFVAVLLAWGLEDVIARRGTGSAVGVGVVTVLLANLPGWDVHVVPESVRSAFHFRANRDASFYRSEYQQWMRQVRSGEQWSVRGKALAVVSEPGDAIVMSAIGAAGYYSDLFVFDRHGFVNTEVSTRPREPLTAAQLKSPGHDDPVEDSFFLDRGYEPTYLFGRLRSAPNRRKLIKQLSGQREKVKRDGLEGVYYADFWPVAGTGVSASELTFLLVWKRTSTAEALADGWRTYDRKLAKLGKGKDLPTIDIDAGQVR